MAFAFLAAVVCVFGMVFVAGLAWFVRKRRAIAGTVIVLAVPLVAWASHYSRSLAMMAILTDDQQWHRMYAAAILWGVPIALALGGLVGFGLHQRDYSRQFPSTSKGSD